MAEKPMYDRFVELEQIVPELAKRIVNLEQQVANQALYQGKLGGRLTAVEDVQMQHSDKLIPVELKSQAAATQATEHLYAPLRSDTKPLLEMSAFVRKVAWVDFRVLGDGELVREFIDTIIEAREILKRST